MPFSEIARSSVPQRMQGRCRPLPWLKGFGSRFAGSRSDATIPAYRRPDGNDVSGWRTYTRPLMRAPTQKVQADGLRVGIVVSRYHGEVTTALARGAREAFRANGGSDADLLQIDAPGAFELPVLASAFAHDGDVDAVVALGCVVTGETKHDEYICRAVAEGLMRISVDTGIPMGFGLLTVSTIEQAMARAGGAHGNKGEEAMLAALSAALSIRALAEAADGGSDDGDR